MKNWLMIMLASFLAYGGSLKYGFSQDDFYFLLISQANSIKDVLEFFSPWHQQGFAFFRPLGTQFYFYLFQQNAWAMHLFMLILHSFNGYLVTKLVARLKHNPPVPLLIGILYTTSAVHFLSLYYISATQQLLATFFGLISLNSFLDKKYWQSALLLIPGLLSKETAIVIPVIALLLYQLEHQTLAVKKLFKPFLPYFLSVLIYLLLRFSAGVVVQSEYSPVLNLSLVSTLRWYWLFGYGAPEELMRYSGMYLFVNFFRYIRDLGWIAAVSTVVTVSASLIAILIAGKSALFNRPLSRVQISVYISWFLAGIALVVAYPHHRYPHYLDLALIPLLLLAVTPLKGVWRYLMVLLILLGSWSGINLSASTHWTTGRAKMGARALSFFEAQDLCKYNTLQFVGEGNAAEELSYTLSLENGPRVICDNPRMTTYYGETDNMVDAVIDITQLVRP